MVITVLLFASYADAFGASSIDLELPGAATVSQMLEKLGVLASGRIPPRPLVAINQQYARPSDSIRAGDEVAIIPPVAGG